MAWSRTKPTTCNERQPVGKLTELDGSGIREFYYSARAFEDIRRNVEAQSGWKYSGEADLLLAWLLNTSNLMRHLPLGTLL